MQRLAVRATIICVGVMSMTILIVFSISNFAHAGITNTIGTYTAAEGTVTVRYPGRTTAVPVEIRDSVRVQHVITTGQNSRAKVLFLDDSIITLGENSSVEIAEHVFDPNANRRSTILNLMKGTIRVLIGKPFLGVGSKFEVHTETASIATRGTYMVIWIEAGTPDGTAVPASYVAQGPPRRVPGTTGLAILGGEASLTSGGVSVPFKTGRVSFAAPGAAPSIPVPFFTMPSVTNQIAETAVQSESNPEGMTSTETIVSHGQSSYRMTQAAATLPGVVSPTGGHATRRGDGSETTAPTAGDATGQNLPIGTPTVDAIPPIIQTPVDVQMIPDMVRTDAASRGGRQPTGTLTLDLDF